jgi:uncharacterized membrane protein YvbJ
LILVYCTKCGTENEEEATECSSCGAPLNISHSTYRRRDWDMEDNCFGGRDKTTWPIIFGGFLILLGLSTLLDDVFSWFRFDTLWPVFIIGIGLLIVSNAIRKRR